MIPRWVVILLIGSLLGLVACRHVVVERDAGRVDSKRSITSSSDLQWSVEREPAPAETETPL